MPFYEVTGAYAKTGTEGEIRVEANSEHDAELKARKKGLLVNQISRCPDLEPGKAAEKSAFALYPLIQAFAAILAAVGALCIIVGSVGSEPVWLISGLCALPAALFWSSVGVALKLLAAISTEVRGRKGRRLEE